MIEYNGSFVQDRPVPYRHCLGNALLNAEMLQVFMLPRNHIFMANSWQFANEYWGAVKGYPQRGEPTTLRPLYHVFALYHAHFGAELLEAKVEGESYETAGLPSAGLAPHAGQGNPLRLVGPRMPLDQPWSIDPLEGVSQRQDEKTLEVQFNAARDVNYFHARKTVAAEPNALYRICASVRTESLDSRTGAGLQVGDARGWVQTQSAAVASSLTGTSDWTEVCVDYRTLADTREIEVRARRLEGGGPVTGCAFFRDIRIRRIEPRSFAAVPFLAVNARCTADRRSVCLMVVNKRLDGPTTASLKLVGGLRPGRATAYSLEGPSVDAVNEQRPDTVAVHEHALEMRPDGQLFVSFAPHSLTALVIESALPWKN